MIEGKQIAAKDEEYRKKEAEAAKKRKEDAILLRSDLLNMKSKAKEIQEAEKLRDLEHEKRVQSWVSRKSRQNQQKKEIERRWFEYELHESLISF
jgi:hypothetical protein